MSVARDIVATYRSPRAVMRRLLGMGPREDRALMYLIVACLLIFVAQWPQLRREALFDDTVPFDARIGAALFGWIFIVPLFAYGLAFACRRIAGFLGGHGTGFSARLALFWSLLAASPLWLLNGLVAGFIGPSAQLSVTGFVAFLAFALFWGLTMVEAETGGEQA
ncbi:MAG: YIP1 family protein [Rhodobacteraceae bacterium]|nr:YIP1 family protein [Paracoccaceae bacterium]